MDNPAIRCPKLSMWQRIYCWQWPEKVGLVFAVVALLTVVIVPFLG